MSNQLNKHAMRNKTIQFEVEGIGAINISATMKGKCNGTKSFELPHYAYKLKIWSEHGSMTATFHDSAYAYTKGIKKLDEEALKGALECIMLDILMYLNDEISGCFEPEERAEMKKVENGCRKEYERFTNVVGGDKNVAYAIEKLMDKIDADMFNQIEEK